MATDVKNTAAGDTGSAKNGGITVQANRNNFQYQDAAAGNVEHLIAKFDLQESVSGDPADGAKLVDRFDDPRYYQGDATT